MSETKHIAGVYLKPKVITNQLLWEISEMIVSRINIAMDNKLDKHEIDVLEGGWFDYLLETLTNINDIQR